MFAKVVNYYKGHLKTETVNDLSQILETTEKHHNDNKMLSDQVILHLYSSRCMSYV